jgi:aminopeptidase
VDIPALVRVAHGRLDAKHGLIEFEKEYAMDNSDFNLTRLMTTVFRPKPEERVGVFIDLPDPREVGGMKFLDDAKLTTRRIAYDVFYRGLIDKKRELPFASVDFYAYEMTGGSNLDLPPTVVDLNGRTLRLVEDVLSRLQIVLYLSTFSATAPLTALAKRMGFRGATLHGCNETILRTGLAKDYEEVSAKAERFRRALTACDDVVLEFETLGRSYRLTLELGRQEAQKSHGLCRTPGEIANLPAGEIYWVPTDAHGQFPMKFKEDATLALMDVAGLRIRQATLLRGDEATVQRARALFQADPATGELGELGLGTQVLPVAGADIQDEKILGTVHVATGRDDHLGGSLDPSKFKDRKHATHEDILFAPHKTPEINLNGAWMHKDGKEVLLIKDYQPSEFVKQVAL